jgi:hypothetical protein
MSDNLRDALAVTIAFATGRPSWEYQSETEVKQAAAVVSILPNLMREHPDWFELSTERRPRFQGHSDGFNDGLTLAADRLVTPWIEIPDEVLSDEAIQMLRERLSKIDNRPSTDDLLGIAPDWTGGLTTDEFVARQRRRGNADPA